VRVTWPRFRRRPVSGSPDERSSVPCEETPPPFDVARLSEARDGWLAWYAAQPNVIAPGWGCPLSCPCCGHATLAERGAEERCSECGWYDDGQDDHDSAVVRGGPNGCLSLDAARLRYLEGGGTTLPRHPRE
jgi:hypothetical protein